MRYAKRAAKLPSPLPSSTDTLLSSMSVVARSGLVSPSKSAVTSALGARPVVAWTGALKRGSAAAAGAALIKVSATDSSSKDGDGTRMATAPLGSQPGEIRASSFRGPEAIPPNRA